MSSRVLTVANLLCAVFAAVIAVSCSRQSPADVRAIAVSVDSLLTAGDTLAALELGEKLLHDKPAADSLHSNTFNVILNLANANARVGHFSEAAQLYEHLLRQGLPADSSAIAGHIAVLQEFGLLCCEIGDDSIGKVLLDSALTLRESLYSENHWRYAIGLSALALADMRGQSWSAASSLLESAIPIYQQSGTAADSLLLQAWINFATVRAELGDFAGEQSAMTKVQELLESKRQVSPLTRSLAHNALSLYFDRIGDLHEGLEHQILSVSFLEQAYGSRHPLSLLTRANLLVSYSSLEDLTSLRRELNRLRDDLNLVTSNSSAIADACRICGSFYLNLNELTEADRLLRRALNLYEQFAAPLSRDRADCLQALAQLEQKRGDIPAALALGRQSLNIARANFLELFDNLSDTEAYSYSRQLRDLSDFYLSLLREQPPDMFLHSTEFAEAVVTGKSVVTDALMIRSGILRELHDPLARTLLNSLVERRKELQPVRAPAGAESGDVISNIERIQRQLAEMSARYRSGRDLLNFGLNDVSQAIPPGAILVEYYRYTHTDREDSRSPRYAAVILGTAGLLANIDLGDAAPIDAAALRWSDDLAVPEMLNLERNRKLTVQLRKLIWDPLESYTTEANLLLISPDAALSGVAFHALTLESGRFLIEEHPLHYLSAARDVRRKSNGQAVARNPLLLALADPEYTHTRLQRAPQTLPFAAMEAVRFAALWNEQLQGVSHLYSGARATESVLLAEASNTQAIYIASHADKGSLSPELEHELLLAGQSLILAGDSAGENDGILTAAEISQLDLSGVNLVVLSACESARGMQFDGEGSFSLRRAFQLAGAECVISTLWRVDDRSTADLMANLLTSHRHNIPLALQSATVHRLNQLRISGNQLADHPYLWAGFFSSGNWELRLN